MLSVNQKSKLIFHFAPFLLFFLLGTFYLFCFTNYIFFYQEKSSLFLVSLSYLVEHLYQPGGFLKYLGELQSAFYFYPIVGAVVVSFEIILIIFLISKTARILSGRNYFFLPFLIGAVLFYLQTNYQYFSFNNLGVLIQVFSFYWIVRYFKGNFLWILIVIFPLQYFLFGSFSVIFLLSFSVFVVLNEKQKGLLKLVLIWVGGIIFFFVGKEFMFFQTTKTLLQFPYSVLKIGDQSFLFISTLLLISILPIFYNINTKLISSISFKRIKLVEITPFLIIGVLIFVSIPRIGKKNSHYFHVEKLFYEQKYDEIIAFNSLFPSNNILTNFFNNIALSETGQLNYKLFDFPQSSDSGTLFLKWEIVGEVLKRGGYFYYSLGIINEAQRWAYEYMVMRGNTPEILKMLIKTELINGNYSIASKYILILKKSVFYRKEALAFEEFIMNEAAIDSHPELGGKKLLKTKQDFFVISENPVKNLDLILAGDSTNKIAMEYKLADLLLQKKNARDYY